MYADVVSVCHVCYDVYCMCGLCDVMCMCCVHVCTQVCVICGMCV